jgi:hypothetical protein
MTSDGVVPDAVTDAYNILDANMKAVTGYANLSRTGTATKTGTKLASRIDFRPTFPSLF